MCNEFFLEKENLTEDELFRKNSYEKINLATERFLLRPIRISDASDLFLMFSDPKVTRLTSLFTLHKNIEETESFIDKKIKESNLGKIIYLAVISKLTGEAVGIISIYDIFDNQRSVRLVIC